jgi:sarcosine oxidase
MMGAPDSAVVAGSIASARIHRLPHQVLEASDIRRRFPALHPAPETVALFEENAGFVLAEASVKAHQDRAQSLGARLQFEETVQGWEAKGSGVSVHSSRGSYQADRLVITANARFSTGLIPGAASGHFYPIVFRYSCARRRMV